MLSSASQTKASQTLLVELTSWEKYNPRNGAKAWSWFRFENDFFDDPVVYDLPALHKLLLIYLFSRRNKLAKPVFQISLNQASVYVGASTEALREGIAALVATGKVRVHDSAPVEPSTYADVRESTQTYVNVRERTEAQSSQVDPRTLRNETVRDETDNTTRPPESPPASRRPVSPSALVEIWNAGKAASQPQVMSISPKSRRWAHAKSRLAETPDLEHWRTVVARIAKSPFCRGEVQRRDGARAWIANFDWLVRPDTHVKVLEGHYDDGSSAKKLKILSQEDL